MTRSIRSGSSVMAAAVARVRSRLDRPATPGGDPDAGRRLADDLRAPFPFDRGRTLTGYMRGRTRFFDGVVLDAVAEPGQVVLVGAGYDDRSLRFRTPGVQFIEVDHPSTHADKRARLDRLGIDVSDVRFIPVDLDGEDPNAALEPHLDPALPTTVVMEAVFPYLCPERAEAVLAALARLPGRPLRLALDVPMVPTGLPGRAAVGVLRLGAAMVGEPIRNVLGRAEFDDMLRRTGWQATTTTTGRQLDMPAAAREQLFVTAVPLRPTAAG